MKTKRIIAFITMLVMSITVISQCFVTAFAEDTVISTDGSAVGAETFIDDVEVSGTNSVGDLLASEFQEKQAEQLENNGYNIFSIEMDGNIATVDFQAQGSCTLIVGIYDDSATTMLASGTAEVQKEETLATVEIPVIAMPDYFYIKAYLVNSETLEPLCIEYTNPNYTQHMQEFFSKTTDDFDSEKVLNFDDDKTNNFAVYNDEVTIIPYEEGFNTSVTYDEETGTYTVENASENIQSLKEGDLFAYDDEVLGPVVAKIDGISVDGTTVTITIGNTDIHEVFDYIRIDASQYLGDAEVECYNDTEFVETDVQDSQTVNLPGEPALKSKSSTEVSKKFEFKHTFKESEFTDKVNTDISKNPDRLPTYTGKFNMTGYVSFTVSVSAKLNLDNDTVFLELKIPYSSDINFTVSAEASFTLPLGQADFSPVIGFYITLVPSVKFSASGSMTASIKTEGSFGLKVNEDKTVKNITKAPQTTPDLKINGKLFFGIDLTPSINIISDKIASVSATGLIGIELIGTLEKKVSTDTEMDMSKIAYYHDCYSCIDGDFNFVVQLSFELTLLKNNKISIQPVNVSYKIGDFYYSMDRDEFNLGECPYKAYRIELRVKDSKNNYIEDAVVSRKSGAYVKEMTLPYVVSELKEAKSGEDGKLALYFNLGTTELSISKDGYKPNVVRLETSVDEDNNLFINGKQATSHDIILSDITYKVVINVKDSDDNVVPYPEVKYKDSRLHNVGGDKDGVVEFDVKPGDYDFDISQYDCSPCTLSETIDKDSEFDVQLEKLGKGDVKFIIKDRDGNPLQRIMVTSTGLHVGRSNTDGVVIFTNMNEGTHKAYLRNSDYTNQKTVEFTVIRDDTVEVEVVMGDDDAEEITTTAETSSDETVTITSTTTPVSTNIVDSGTCGADGDNLTWTLDDESTLTISGTGYMDDYYRECYVPWYSHRNDIKTVIINDGVTNIGLQAFCRCSSLTSITIPDSVTSIGWYVFVDCDSLTSITIPDSVTSIGVGAFEGCSGLTSITLPNTITSIGEMAFYDCDSLTSITIENPDCKIHDDSDTIPKTTTIYGYSGSTAQAYAEKYKRKFVAIDKPETISLMQEEPIEILAEEPTETADDDYIFLEPAVHSLTDLLPNAVYNYYILYDNTDTETILNPGNIQYITQFTTDENGSAEINLGYSEITDEAVRMSVPVSPNETPIVSSVTLGDVNQDGMTDASDASQILGIYAVYSTGGTPDETEQQLLSADVNSDGMVDASDASTVLAYYAYLSTGGTVNIETFMSSEIK